MTAADDDDLLLVLLLYTSHCLDVACPLEEVVRQNDVFFSFSHRREPGVEIWIETLLSTVREHNGLGAEGDLGF